MPRHPPPPAARRALHRAALWLATLALGLQLLAPGLCLAQRLASMPLGAICSAAARDAGSAQMPSSEGAHGLQDCGHCAAPQVALAEPLAPPAWRLLRAALPPPGAASAPAVAPSSWRPPPRGPPLSA